MTAFDCELKIFEEIKNKYKPLAGFDIVVDIAAYKAGNDVVYKFVSGSTDFFNLVSIERNDKNLELAVFSSGGVSTLHYFSKTLRAYYDYDKNLLADFEDFTPNPYALKRTFKHQISLLLYDLNTPKATKPAC